MEYLRVGAKPSPTVGRVARRQANEAAERYAPVGQPAQLSGARRQPRLGGVALHSTDYGSHLLTTPGFTAAGDVSPRGQPLGTKLKRILAKKEKPEVSSLNGFMI